MARNSLGEVIFFVFCLYFAIIFFLQCHTYYWKIGSKVDDVSVIIISCNFLGIYNYLKFKILIVK